MGKKKNGSAIEPIKSENESDTNMVEFKDMFRTGQPMLSVLRELLKDRTTRKNIVWATDTYSRFGYYYQKEQQMFPDFNINLILNGDLLPRIQKTKEQQQSRTKAKAEVFTPSWICNKMNNFCDAEWFGRDGVFNTENEDHTWTVNKNRIEFPESRNKKLTGWQDYVDSRRIEITCGEAPYLVSRYDATTGESLPIYKRIGILDRKLRVVNENTASEEEWYKWTVRAFQASYGFEYQGDNLFFARVNLVQTFIDYYQERFEKIPDITKIREIAKIVSWNIWQMDGLKDTCPLGIPDDTMNETDMEPLFGFESVVDKTQESKPVYCRVMDWRANTSIEFRDLKKGAVNE